MASMDQVLARAPLGRLGTPDDIAVSLRLLVLGGGGLHHGPADQRERRLVPVTAPSRRQQVGERTLRSGLRTKRLGNVGAESSASTRRLLERRRAPGRLYGGARAESGVLVFRGLHIDDETQIAFSKRLDDVGKDEPAEPPRHLQRHARPGQDRHRATAPGDLPLAYRRRTGRGPDQGHDAQRACHLVDGRRDRVRQHVRGLRRRSTTRRRSGSRVCGSCTPSRRRSGWCTRTPRPRTSSAGARSPTASTRSCGSTARAAAPS